VHTTPVKNTSLLFGCKTKLGCGNYRNGVWRAFFFFHWFQFALTDWNGNGKESTVLDVEVETGCGSERSVRYERLMGVA